MTFLTGDSFDHYATADLGLKWTLASGVSIAAVGRNGTNGLRFTTASFVARFVSRNLNANYATLVVGFAVSVSGILGVPVRIMSLYDGASEQLNLIYNPDQTLALRRGATVLATTAVSLTLDTKYYVELQATIHGTTGAFDLRLNQVSRASATNVNTQVSANAFANTVVLGSRPSTGNGVGAINIDYDDFTVTDGTFLGDVKGVATFPNGAGNLSQWAANGAATSHEAVDDTTPDGDTTYISSATAGDVALHTHGDVVAGTVYATQSCILARKDDAGAVEIREKARQDAANYDGATVSLGDTYLYYLNVRTTAPDGTAWDTTKFNAVEWGVERVT